jgi:hypothetical protein
MGVATARTQKARVPGTERRTVTKVTFDNSYEANGEPLPAAKLGLQHVDFAICTVIHGSEAEGVGTGASYEAATGKIHLLNSKTGKEVVAAVDCSHVVVEVVAFGR